jgi:ATP-binding cassette, subfamily C (CFTR/MRP), member 1
MDETRSAAFLGSKLEEAWESRVAKAEAYNLRLQNGEIRPGTSTQCIWWCLRNIVHPVSTIRNRKIPKPTREQQETRWRLESRRTASLAWALNDVLGNRFWIAGAYKVPNA